MRYLRQLARETAARVMPTRQPLWMPPIAPLVNEQIAHGRVGEWPGISSADSTGSNVDGHEAYHEPEQLSHQRTRTETNDMGLDSMVRGKAAHGAIIRTVNPLARGDDERTPPEYVNLDSSDEARQSRPIDSASSPSGQFESRDRSLSPSRTDSIHGLAPTSQSKSIERSGLHLILAEVARRQRELEVRYEMERGSSVGSPSGAEQTAVGRSSPEDLNYQQDRNDDVHLSIGSIVVQVEGPQKPLIPQRGQAWELRRTRTQNTSNRWARSYLDR